MLTPGCGWALLQTVAFICKHDQMYLYIDIGSQILNVTWETYSTPAHYTSNNVIFTWLF